MTITVSPTVQVGNAPPRVSLAVTASAGETSTTVMRRNSDGSLVPVRTFDGGPLPLSAGSGSLFDYEMPYGTSVSYTTRESPATVSSSVNVAGVSQPWLVHVGVPGRSMPVVLRPGSLQEETYTVKRGVFRPLGRVHPIIVTDGTRSGPSSSLLVNTASLTDLAFFKALIADSSTLLLNIPADLTPAVGFDTSYISIDANKIGRLTDVVIDAYRDFALPFDVVDMPLGGQQPQRTLADLLVYPTLADINSHYATLNAIFVGP